MVAKIVPPLRGGALFWGVTCELSNNLVHSGRTLRPTSASKNKAAVWVVLRAG